MELSPAMCAFLRETALAFSGAPRRRFIARALEQFALSQRQAQRLLRLCHLRWTGV
jgi:hypothetical protein